MTLVARSIGRRSEGTIIESSRGHYDTRPATNYKTPGYFSKLRNGDPLPVTPWARTFFDMPPKLYWEVYRTRMSTGEVVHHFYDGHFDHFRSGSASFPNPMSSTTLGHTTNRLLLKAESEAKNAAWDILTFMAEYGKTHKMVRTAYTTARKRVSDILNARGRRGKLVKTWQEFAATWLEYRYGWRILAYDLQDAWESMERLRQKGSILDRYSAHEQFTGEETQNGGTFLVPGMGGGWNPSSYVIRSQSVRRTTTVDLRVGVGARTTFLSSYTVNPLLTGWELVPFSFMVDWFVDVGSVLGALTPTFGRSVTHRFRSISRRYSSTLTLGIKPHTSTSSYLYVGDSLNTTNTGAFTQYNRESINGPGFSLHLNPRLDFSKFVDVVALATSMKRGVFNELARRR